MRSRLLVLLLATTALAGALVANPPASPLQLALEAPTPEPVAAGASETVTLTVQREADGRPAVGPGRVEVRLEAPKATACGPAVQTVHLDPATGRGQANVTCTPMRPGSWPLLVQARAPGHAEARWAAELTVSPDELDGRLHVGDAQGYRFPVQVDLRPAHLDRAPANLTLVVDHRTTPLAFTRGPTTTVTGTGSFGDEIVARHGPGDYLVQARADGPFTQPWEAAANLSVAEPPGPGHLELNATVEAGEPRVELTGDGVNDDGKHKRPGGELITRLKVENADAVNVTVLRAQGDERIAIDERRLPVPADGHLEHVFAHEPLPADQLWVQAHTGDSATARTAQIRDLRAEATLLGPEAILADGRTWQGHLVLFDPNFGSTPADPGPVFGLPDVTWTVYRGSHVAEGHTVKIGPFTGPSEGSAATSRVPWPQGTDGVEAEPGRAIFPVELTPPAEADEGSYRLSVYAPDGTRLGGGSWTLQAAPEVSLTSLDPRPGEPLAVAVAVADPVTNVTVELQLSADGERVARTHLAGAGNASLALPAPLAAGTPVRVEAHADWPGRPERSEPDAVAEATVPDLGPEVSVHAALDGRPAPVPVPVHPAGSHEITLAYTARDPNAGPVELDEVTISGPDGPPGWPIDGEEGLVRVEVPEQARVGRYVVELAAEDGGERASARVPVEVAASLRLQVDGPEEITLTQGGTRRANLTVANHGSLPVEEVRLLVDTDLDLAVQTGTGGDWIGAGEPVSFPLGPGEARELPVRFAADGASGQGTVELTVAGVVP